MWVKDAHCALSASAADVEQAVRKWRDRGSDDDVVFEYDAVESDLDSADPVRLYVSEDACEEYSDEQTNAQAQVEWNTSGSEFIGARVARRFTTGDTSTESFAKGDFYAGTVKFFAAADGDDAALWRVYHDDGDIEDLDEAQLHAAIELSKERNSTSSALSTEFTAGDRVEVLFDIEGNWKRGSQYFPGTISHIVKAGIFHIRFDDGDQKDCSVSDMRRRTGLEASRSSSQMVQATARLPGVMPTETCAICRGTFAAMEASTRICQLHCKHAFCFECIDNWFKVDLVEDGQLSSVVSGKSCPECRRGFASLRKSVTATVADIIAAQQQQPSDDSSQSDHQAVSPRPTLDQSAACAASEALACELCNAAIDGSYGAGRFCDRKCKNTWCNSEGHRCRRKTERLGSLQACSVCGSLHNGASGRHCSVRCRNSASSGQRGVAIHETEPGSEEESSDSEKARPWNLWTPEEDQLVIQMVQKEGPGNWDSKAEQLSTSRTGNSIYQRWHNYLRRDDGNAVVPSESARPSSAGEKRTRRQVALEPAKRSCVDNRNAEPSEPVRLWSVHETRQLSQMVTEEGPGHWDRKADRLRTGRTGYAVESRRWRRQRDANIERHESHDESEPRSQTAMFTSPAGGTVIRPNRCDGPSSDPDPFAFNDDEPEQRQRGQRNGRLRGGVSTMPSGNSAEPKSRPKISRARCKRKHSRPRHKAADDVNKRAEQSVGNTNGAEMEIEQILGSRTDPGNKLVYRVRWRGFGSEHDTWEPRSNLENAQECMAAFEGQNLEQRPASCLKCKSGPGKCHRRGELGHLYLSMSM
jgi:hypothetical protein